MIDPSCDTFSYISNECKLLKSDQLFKDNTAQFEIYMDASLAARQYNQYLSMVSLLVIVTLKSIFINPNLMLRKDSSPYPIAVDGSWSAWVDITSCKGTCDTGSKPRARTCTSPAPARGGWVCNGEPGDTASCTLAPCPSTILR